LPPQVLRATDRIAEGRELRLLSGLDLRLGALVRQRGGVVRLRGKPRDRAGDAFGGESAKANVPLPIDHEVRGAAEEAVRVAGRAGRIEQHRIGRGVALERRRRAIDAVGRVHEDHRDVLRGDRPERLRQTGHGAEPAALRREGLQHHDLAAEVVKSPGRRADPGGVLRKRGSLAAHQRIERRPILAIKLLRPLAGHATVGRGSLRVAASCRRRRGTRLGARGSDHAGEKEDRGRHRAWRAAHAGSAPG